MNWIYVIMEFLSKKEELLKIGKFLGYYPKTCDDIPNNGWNVVGMEMEGRKLMQSKQIFKAFSDKIYYLIYPQNPNLHGNNDVQETKVFQSLKENLTNPTFLEITETSVTAASIISESFELKHARQLMEEHFSQLGEYNSASVSQRKTNREG